MILEFNPFKWGKPTTIPSGPAKGTVVTVAAQPAPPQETHMSFLSTIGKDIKAIFGFIGSPKGQSIIATGEGVALAIDPGLAGALTLANAWLTEIVKTEGIAAAAGAQTGTGSQKAAAVLSTVTPEVLAFAAANKLPVPGAAQITAANTALVAFLNALGAPESSPAA